MSNIKIEKFEKELNCEVQMPGSKSYTNRVLILASLASGKSKITAPLHSDDTKYMIKSLKKLGIKIGVLASGDIEIEGNGGKFDNLNSKNLFAGIAGTTSRFLTAFSVLTRAEINLSGEGKILERPIGDLVDGLRQIGVEIEYTGKNGSLPLKINGKNINSSEIKMNGEVSSQFFTALMLIAPYLESGLKISVIGKQISKSYIDITINLMREFGVEVKNNDYKEYIIKGGQKYKAREYKVEGDWSSASYFCALGALHRGSTTIKNLNNNSSQGDKNFPKVLEKMGVKVEYLEDGVKIFGGSLLSGIEINMEQMPDTAMTVAILAVFANKNTLITGLSTLKDKETDRIEAMKEELGKMGVLVKTTDSSMEIIPSTPKSAIIKTYKDHRIAMVFAVLGSKVGNVIIKNKEVVNKSFPEFWEILKKVGINLSEQEKIKNVLLIGFRASGKSSICGELAEKLSFKCIDLDKFIENKEQKSISEISKSGSDWESFRKLEHNALAQVLSFEKTVISAGGGVGVNDILEKESGKTYGQLNRELIQNSNATVVVFVDAEEEKLLERIELAEKQKFNSRPLLNVNSEKLKKQLKNFKIKEEKEEFLLSELIKDSKKAYRKRKPLYESLANITVNTTLDKKSQSVEKILNQVID